MKCWSDPDCRTTRPAGRTWRHGRIGPNEPLGLPAGHWKALLGTPPPPEDKIVSWRRQLYSSGTCRFMDGSMMMCYPFSTRFSGGGLSGTEYAQSNIILRTYAIRLLPNVDIDGASPAGPSVFRKEALSCSRRHSNERTWVHQHDDRDRVTVQARMQSLHSPLFWTSPTPREVEEWRI